MSGAGRPKRDELAIVKLAADLWEQEAQEVGYLARVFTQTSLPYRNPGDDLAAWVRHNGNRSAGLTLTLKPGTVADRETGQPLPIGYPYGTIPRLLLAWLSTEAVRTKERTIPLGDSLSDFMRQLGLAINGGQTGTINKLKNHARRLFRSSVEVEYWESVGAAYGYEREAYKHFKIAEGYDLWVGKSHPDQLALVPSYVELSEKFFEEVTTRPVPISLDALRKLRGSAMRLDIYAWLTHRMSYLRKPTMVRWELLAMQFGSNAQTDRGWRKFRSDFLKHLAQVRTVYPDASVTETKSGLLLSPSRTAVSRTTRRILD